MSRPTLQTEHIQLRPMTLEHLPHLVELDSDPEVMRYLLGRPRSPHEATGFWTPRCLDTYADAVGLGWWVGFRGSEFLGWWDLGRSDSEPADLPSLHSAEIGWRLLRRHWRQGLASEGARALLRHGFATVGLRRVWAETMAVNAGSRGVMRKIGMRHIDTRLREWTDPVPGAERGEVVYEMTRSQWQESTRSPEGPCRT